MASMVVTPEITISPRTLAIMLAAAGSRGFSSSADAVLMALNHPGSRQVMVAEQDAGERLDRVLARHIAELSRSRLKALILAGEVAIGGRTIRDPGHRVNAGDAAAVALPAPEPAGPQAEAIALDIAYEDDEIIVINKPKAWLYTPPPAIARARWSMR